MEGSVWASFCISTFKRPELLKQQLALLLAQTFPDFEIVISDNDPEASAREVAESFHDPRIKYFANGQNLGMVKSFNLSIQRAVGTFVVMVTDDDPVDKEFLQVAHSLSDQYPGYSCYCGFLRACAPGSVEVIHPNRFMEEILDTDKTKSMLWSSCAMRREHVIAVGLMPDYGSPHLADHALMAMTGSIAGGVIINKMYSSLTSHNTNFSKAHIDSYLGGCKGFYALILNFSEKRERAVAIKKALLKHLRVWFIGSIFNLKRFYTSKNPNPAVLEQVNEFSLRILDLPFMKQFRYRYYLKDAIFKIKSRLGLLK